MKFPTGADLVWSMEMLDQPKELCGLKKIVSECLITPKSTISESANQLSPSQGDFN